MKRGRSILATAIFLCLAPGTVAGLIPFWISGWWFEPPFFGLEPVRWFGVLLIALAAPVLLESFARFALEGLGTPAPVLPTQHLVVKRQTPNASTVTCGILCMLLSCRSLSVKACCSETPRYSMPP